MTSTQRLWTFGLLLFVGLIGTVALVTGSAAIDVFRAHSDRIINLANEAR